MKTATLLLAAAAGSALASLNRHQAGPLEEAQKPRIRQVDARAACNADNCARAVTGTGRVPAATQSADCASFFRFTVTPAAVTSTVTVTPAAVTVVTTDTTVVQTVTSIVSTAAVATATTNVEIFGNNRRRQQTTGAATTVSPTAIPAYASPCSGTARYSSACSCLGASRTTTTAAAPTVVTTVTAATPTAVVEATAFSTVVLPATATVGFTAVDQILCGRNITGPYDDVPITVVCEAQPATRPEFVLGTDVVPTWDQCVALADGDFDCSSFEYDLDSLVCTRYHDATAEFAAVQATRKVYAYFNV